MTQGFLDKVYNARTPDETRELYDAWSKSYEEEVGTNGYATPARCAEALARFVKDPDTPVLDFGCGTGLSGLALRAAGLQVIDGVDLSDGMLELAARKGAYRTLSTIGPEDPVPDGYTVMAAIGVIGAGAAPATLLERIVTQLPAGGLLVFSFNDHALADPAFTSAADRLKTAGTVVERFCEYGPHLPGQNLGSNVYVFEKA